MKWIYPLIFSMVFYFLGKKGKDIYPFMSGFKLEKMRIKYKDPWILFAFLFIMFEEFIILMSLLEPLSLRAFLFLSLIMMSVLVVMK